MASVTLPLAQITAMGGTLKDDVPPRIVLPPSIPAVVGDTLQLFRRGIVETADPYAIGSRFTLSTGAGNEYPRYWQWTPDAAGSATLTVEALGSDMTVLSSAQTTITVSQATNPASMKRIMCIGDSVTNGMVWPQEAYRRLTQTGGTPAGLELSNYTFIGDQAFPNYPTQKGFGISGAGWSTYMLNPYSNNPFWFDGQLSIAQWVANNGGDGPDLVLVMIGWNNIIGATDSAAGMAGVVTQGKVFADKLHEEYPSAKMVLLGMPVPSPFGGSGTLPAFDRANYYALAHKANTLGIAYQAWASEPAYSSWLRFAQVGAQFDAEYGYPSTNVAVNTRNTTTESRQTEVVHPTTDARKQIADVAFREIVRAFA